MSLKIIILILASITLAYAKLNGNFKCSSISIIKRDQWGSIAGPSKNNMEKAPSKIFVHHTATEECNSAETCKKEVRNQEKFYRDILDENGLDVQFLIGGDGNVYEGTGWVGKGNHTQGYPDDFGVAFIGTFDENPASDKMMYAFREMILCGAANGVIDPSYSLYGHLNARCTTHCPGAYLQDQISQIYRFQSKPIHCTGQFNY